MRTKKFLFALGSAVPVVIVSSVFALGQPFFTPERGTGPSPMVIPTEKHDVSPALRDVPAIPLVAEPPAFREIPRQPLPRRGPKPGVLDPMLQATPGTQAIPSTLQSFEGISNAAQSTVSGFTVAPPDTNGDVGPNHYVQWVNLAFAIYDKAGGKVYGPAAGKTLWSGFGGPCETSNDGDPIVLYDHLADRWFFSQFALPNYPSGPFYQCIAVSTTGDPTGSYNRYAFLFSETIMNDYPKFGVWPDGYYMSVNQFAGSSWAGQGVVAFERAKMLNGASAGMVYFDMFGTDPNLGGMLPSDLDGPAPPSGTPNYFVQFDDDSWGYSPDQLQVWAFSVDWSSPGGSTFTRLTDLPTAPFDSNLCGYALSCIPQPSRRKKLDALSDRLMNRLQYRHFSDHDSLVTNHTVDVDGTDHAGIRWYELRDNGSGWGIEQQGTYAPDSDHRWMGSIAMDSAGNIALGFSVSGSATSPSIRYTGRLAGDPIDQMTLGEASIIEGAGSQTGSNRWGDYSMMAVDPTDDSFWYTQEYYQTTSSTGWQTRIGTFRLAGISPPPPSSVTLTPSPSSPQTAGATVTFTAAASGGSGNYQYQFWLHNGTSWSIAKPYGATNDNTWIWNTTGLATGNYLVEVWARNAGSAAAWEVFSTDIPYVLGAPTAPTSVTLTPPSPASPQAPGASILWTAAASGGSGNYQYQFWLYNGTSWSIAKPYGATNDNTWTWNTTGLATGNYLVEVWARSAGSAAAWEVYSTDTPYVLGVPTAPTTVALTPPPSPASPQAPGASVLWTAVASGGSGNYQYQFWLFNGTSWSIAKPYGATNDNTWTWNTTGLAPGNYLVEVWARSAGSTAAWEVYSTDTPYLLQ